jgi:hypothetical protein
MDHWRTYWAVVPMHMSHSKQRLAPRPELPGVAVLKWLVVAMLIVCLWGAFDLINSKLGLMAALATSAATALILFGVSFFIPTNRL